MKKYNYKAIEKKWQKYWTENKIFQIKEDQSKKKFYVLDMFPYPSGVGLHVGHPKGYIATDVVARMKMMQGYNVLHPMGWDAFGLPAENYALKNKVHPSVATKKNIATFKKQLEKLGFTYDWDREVNTTDPKYYKWTQWIFLQMFKKGLAYESYEPVNWCPVDKTVLSNEDLEDGKCERCGSPVEQRPMRQWVLKITDYAERLLDDLEKLPHWPEAIKEMQRNWIGKSEGAIIDFLMPKYSSVLFATNNKSKKKRVDFLTSHLGLKIKILSPSDVGIEAIDVAEDGSLEENSKNKASAYKGKTDLPILSVDSAFFIENEKIDPVKVKRNALNGADEHSFSQEEIADKMVKYYQEIAKKHGGKVDASWVDNWTLVLPDGSTKSVTTKREVWLTDKFNEKLDINFPIRSLYVVKTTGKYGNAQTEEEEIIELKPVIAGLKELLAEKISVFTTRPDTLFGATYVVMAPENSIIGNLKLEIKNLDEVNQYIEQAKHKTTLERTELQKEKTGVELKGIKAINPANGEELPIFVADYVITGYGTGAIMAVPAHDERDWEFAKKYGLVRKCVVEPRDEETGELFRLVGKSVEEDPQEILKQIYSGEKCYEGKGILINSDFLNGLKTNEAKQKMTEWLEKNNVGQRKTQYKLRDWVFSRQRYWGEPIPLVKCEKCGWVPVPENELPVELPKVKSYEPTGTGESPLANIKKWVNTKCPQCGEKAKRETNTMPQWAGSSWYYLRYIDPHNETALVDKNKEKYWSPVDFYVGGAEHATRHLIYARFWHKFLYDIGTVNYEEPFTRLQQVGLILDEDGRKMSKRWGNVINPDDVVEEFGADSMRVYEMFMGPFNQPCAWSTNGLVGAKRFLDKVWNLSSVIASEAKQSFGGIAASPATPRNDDITRQLHQTIKKVTEDIEAMRFNTAIAKMMELVNEMGKEEKISSIQYSLLLKILSPFAPHITEELWEMLGNAAGISSMPWPEYDLKLLVEEDMTLAIQVNGKLRDTMVFLIETSEEEIKNKAVNNEKIQKWLEGKEPKKIIYVKGKLISIVV